MMRHMVVALFAIPLCVCAANGRTEGASVPEPQPVKSSFEITVGCVNCGAFHYGNGRASAEAFAAAWEKLAVDWPQDVFFYEDVGKRKIGELARPKFDIRAAAKKAPASVDVVELPRTIESSTGEQKTGRYRALRLTYGVGGKKLAVYGVHLVANGHVRDPKIAKGQPSLSQKLRRRQFDALLADARRFDFAILTGDFNAQKAWEYDVFVQAGFVLGNGSDQYGTKATLRNIPADNIILSPGLAFSDFRVLDGYVLDTDHLPLVATIYAVKPLVVGVSETFPDRMD